MLCHMWSRSLGVCRSQSKSFRHAMDPSYAAMGRGIGGDDIQRLLRGGPMSKVSADPAKGHQALGQQGLSHLDFINMAAANGGLLPDVSSYAYGRRSQSAEVHRHTLAGTDSTFSPSWPPQVETFASASVWHCLPQIDLRHPVAHPHLRLSALYGQQLLCHLILGQDAAGNLQFSVAYAGRP